MEDGAGVVIGRSIIVTTTALLAAVVVEVVVADVPKGT
jgi:hypothetical protein